MEQVLTWSRASRSRLGYFAALYHRVTLRIRDGITRGEFEDNPRMERLDVRFANRYLLAVEQHLAGTQPSAVWRVAFETAERWPPLVLQHLLVGMNAHINVDLGIAAARTAPGPKLAGLKNDFDKINAILGELSTGVEDELAHIWPPLRFVLAAAGTVDDVILNFSMSRARQAAWEFATQLAAVPDEARQAQLIAQKDREMAILGTLIAHPGPVVNAVLLPIRLTEAGHVRSKISALSQTGDAAAVPPIAEELSAAE